LEALIVATQRRDLLRHGDGHARSRVTFVELFSTSSSSSR
jgi:hypothetical protein